MAAGATKPSCSLRVTDARSSSAISCGAYGYPLELAVPIAVETVRAFEHLDALERVVFACASESVLRAYEAALSS